MRSLESQWGHITSLIKNNEIDAVVELCRKMKKEEYDIITGRLIEELQSKEDKRYRNTIAIVLSDLKCDDAVETLVELIKDPKNRNCRGTFLYALENLRCETVIKDLIPILTDGNLEVRWIMCELISENIESMNESDRLECMRILREEKRKLWRE